MGKDKFFFIKENDYSILLIITVSIQLGINNK